MCHKREKEEREAQLAELIRALTIFIRLYAFLSVCKLHPIPFQSQIVFIV